MPVRILKIEDQNNIKINNGEIEENKPVGVSSNKKSIMPFSTIFYISNQWTDVGSRIAEHTHKGFEVITIMLKGGAEHTYPHLPKPISLSSGDVEYIYTGNGIKHAEYHKRNSQSFQIWLDPNLRKSLAKKPKIQHFDTSVFPTRNIPGITRNYIVGEDSPLELETENVEIIDYKYSPGLQELKVSNDVFLSLYLVKGEIEIDGKSYSEDTFIVIRDEMPFSFYVNAHSRIIAIRTIASPDYQTYLQLKSNN
ncbi:pirin family protein [Candidatus Kapabacteria bacterium]|nr:pirin family protein [Candidatus Kapabacteria bacterium]